MELIVIEGYPDRINEIEILFRSFGDFNEKVLEHVLRNRVDIVSVYAYEDAKLIACKIGFSPRPMYFESWIGGVNPEHRGKGLAKKLLNVQHEYCKNKGYRYIETIVANENIPMQLVNLKCGMKVVGTFLDRENELKLKFQKEL